MNEKRKRLKIRINVFDIFIILLVLCLIATLVYRVYNAVEENSGRNKTSYVVYFECTGEYNSIEKYLKNGDAVYLQSSGELLGYLTVVDQNSLVEILTDEATHVSETEQITENKAETVTETDSETATETEIKTESETETEAVSDTETGTETGTEALTEGAVSDTTENTTTAVYEELYAAAEVYRVAMLAEEESVTEADTEYAYIRIDFKGALRLNGNAQKSNIGDYFTVGQDKITVGSRIPVYTDSAQFTIHVTEIASN